MIIHQKMPGSWLGGTTDTRLRLLPTAPPLLTATLGTVSLTLWIVLFVSSLLFNAHNALVSLLAILLTADEHIALLGRALTSPLKDGHRIARHLADYVLLWTGGGGDDLAKSPHLARIANSVYRHMVSWRVWLIVLILYVILTVNKHLLVGFSARVILLAVNFQLQVAFLRI